MVFDQENQAVLQSFFQEGKNKSGKDCLLNNKKNFIENFLEKEVKLTKNYREPNAVS